MSRWVGVYKTYENGDRQLIARAKSPYEAIKIAAEHHDDAEHAILSIGSIDLEPGEADTDDLLKNKVPAAVE